MSRSAEDAYGDTPAPYPQSPGHKTGGTSQEAAQKFRAHASDLRAAALLTFDNNPAGLTADEVADRLKSSVLAIRPRISELYKQGKIEKVPGPEGRRKNASGMSATVWRKKTPCAP